MDFGISLDASAVPQRHTLYDSDEEDEENGAKQTELIFIPQILDPEPQKSLALVIAPQPLCSLTSDTPTVFKDRYFPSVGCESCNVTEVYQAEARDEGGVAKTLFCLHEKNLKPENVNSWTEKLFEMFHPTSILVLTSLPSYTHLSSHSHDLSPQSCVLRMINTSSWSHPPFDGATPLQAPNAISGEPAAVLSRCQLRNTPAALAILYTTSSESTAEQVAGFAPLIEHPSMVALNLATKSSCEVSRTVKSLEPKPREDLSSLYA